ncbi:MAG TPA: 4-hydroxy-3-methylbut-2-enyl diphosphate reductase, partial [Cyclobacteriaceae bacterium]
IHHFDIHRKEKIVSKDFIPPVDPVHIVVTSGASCPDTLVDSVILKILGYFPRAKSVYDVMHALESART